MSIKVISGEYGGRKLITPEAISDDADVRPTKARVREAAFNMLGSRVYFDECTVFDLFSGSGAAGIEALSRGAKHVTFVDSTTKWIKQNLELIKAPTGSYLVRQANVLSFKPNATADIIFADPPYRANLIDDTLAQKDTLGHSGSLWMLEVESNITPTFNEADFTVLKNKKYGKSTLWLLKQN